MMVKEIKDDLDRVVILDISGIYAQIHNQGYFDRSATEDMTYTPFDRHTE